VRASVRACVRVGGASGVRDRACVRCLWGRGGPDRGLGGIRWRQEVAIVTTALSIEGLQLERGARVKDEGGHAERLPL